MIRVATIEDAYQLLSKIPELDQSKSLKQWKKKITEDALILIGSIDGEDVGFKIGYPIADDEFYSWLGGVIPNARQTGMAQQLMQRQEQEVRQQGFTCISVKSMNQYPAMLRLLIRNGYQIKSVESFADKQKERIHFIKQL